MSLNGRHLASFPKPLTVFVAAFSLLGAWIRSKNSWQKRLNGKRSRTEEGSGPLLMWVFKVFYWAEAWATH